MKFTKILIGASLLLSMELSAQKITTIVSDTYNKRLDQTTLVLIPNGNVTFKVNGKSSAVMNPVSNIFLEIRIQRCYPLLRFLKKVIHFMKKD